MTKQNKKFWDIRSASDKMSADLFIYGAITSGSKWDETDVTISDFTQSLSDLEPTVKTLNMYVNSPGGSVYTTIAMMNQLERRKDKLTINAYVDSLAASAASFLIMKADNIYMYKNTFLMIHKPMGTLLGANSIECREHADWLDKTEMKTCFPAYLAKGTTLLTEEKLKSFLDGKDHWLSAEEAAQYFNITILEESKDAVACADMDFLQQYSGIPEQLLNINQSSIISAEEMAKRQQIAEEAKANSALYENIIGGIYQ